MRLSPPSFHPSLESEHRGNSRVKQVGGDMALSKDKPMCVCVNDEIACGEQAKPSSVSEKLIFGIMGVALACTREIGHMGPHIACGVTDHCIIEWSTWDTN